jgi:hypothetical protein
MPTPTAPSPRWPSWTLLLAVILGLVVLPWLTSGYVGRIIINACRNLVLALSFDIVGGYTGYINLGHAAFFGIGAYAFGICVNAGVSVLLAGGTAVLLTALFAALISYPFFRLRGAVLFPGHLRPAQIVRRVGADPIGSYRRLRWPVGRLARKSHAVVLSQPRPGCLYLPDRVARESLEIWPGPGQHARGRAGGESFWRVSLLV